MDKWHDMGVVTGGAAAALTGLLFVAVTLRIDTIAAARDLRSRAAQTLTPLTLFVTSLVVAIDPRAARPRVFRYRLRQPAARSRWRRRIPGRAPANPEWSDRARRPFLRRQCDLHRRHRQRAGPGARLLQRLDV